MLISPWQSNNKTREIVVFIGLGYGLRFAASGPIFDNLDKYNFFFLNVYVVIKINTIIPQVQQ